jgi:iron(III) transport system substrate-binding protein
MQILLWVLSVLSILFPASLFAQSPKSATISELVTYNGKDREALLYAGAKTEGKVTWYTSLAGASYKAMVNAFESKYPGVQVEAYRANGGEITNRILEEARAKRPIVDTIETTEANLMFQRESFLLRPYHSPYFAAYPNDAKVKGERGLYFWATARESYIGFGYNKNLLAKDAVPKNYQGLLHPALKGRMGLTIDDTSTKVIAALLKIKGLEFVKKLKGQDIALHTIIPPALLDLIAAGELVAGAAIFRNHVIVAQQKGAPVEWVAMDIVPTNVGGVAIAAQPPHPHGALLLADYLLGPEGQGLLEKYHYGNGAKNYGFKKWRPEQDMPLDKYEKELERWQKILKETGRKGA